MIISNVVAPLQGMMANRYMNTFRDEILGWNKKLMNVADVNQIMTEIQRTWAYLESLFIHSEEVKKELPEAAVRFANIDKEVKIILKVGLLELQQHSDVKLSAMLDLRFSLACASHIY